MMICWVFHILSCNIQINCAVIITLPNTHHFFYLPYITVHCITENQTGIFFLCNNFLVGFFFRNSTVISHNYMQILQLYALTWDLNQCDFIFV